MARKLLLHPFEVGASETWEWKTDVIETIDNREQRISVRPYPDETLEVTMRFGGDGQTVFANETVNYLSPGDAIVRNFRDSILARDEVTLAMWHLQDSIVSATWLTTTRRLEFQFGLENSPFLGFKDEEVLAHNDGAWYKGKLESFDSETLTGVINFGVDTGLAATAFKQLVLLRSGIVDRATTISYVGASHGADFKFAVRLSRNQYRTQVTAGNYTLNNASPSNRPILIARNIGLILDLTLDHGTKRIETDANFPYYVSRWREPTFSFSIKDFFQRTSKTNKRWSFWRAFLNAIRGSQGAFWLPTRRDDFEIVSQIADTSVTLKGRQYFDLWNETNIKALAFESTTGTIRIKEIEDCDLDGNGDSLVQFLPTGLLTPIAHVSLAFPCRIDGDSVSMTHDSSNTELSFKAVSVQWLFTPTEIADPVDPGLIAQIDGADAARVVAAGRISSIPIRGSAGGTMLTPANEPALWPSNGLTGPGFEGGDWLAADGLASRFNFIHNGTQDWQISIAFKVGSALQDSAYLLDTRTSGNRGILVWVNPDTDYLGVEIYGTSGTFSGTVPNMHLSGHRFVVEIRFVNVTDQIQVYVNDVLRLTFTHSGGFAFNSASTSKFEIGSAGEDFAVFETLIRSDSTSKADYLKRKWFPSLWASIVTDTAQYAVTDLLNFAVVTTDDN